MPRWNAISVSGYHIRDAGSTAAQEMGFALANAIAYMDAVLERGISIDDFASRISWIFNTQNNFFEEVAKYRALRRLWATILREQYGAKKPASMTLRTHIQTGGATLTAQQPLNNIARAGFQALASVLGGIQSMALSCYDEALALPTEEAQATALRTQQIIAHEIGATEVIDPLAGSYYVELLTDKLEAEARGGSTRYRRWAARSRRSRAAGWSSEIADSAWRAPTGHRVGRAAHRRRQRLPVPRRAKARGNFRPDPETYRTEYNAAGEAQGGTGQRRRRGRAGQAAPDRTGSGPSHTNLMPPILDAVLAYATRAKSAACCVRNGASTSRRRLSEAGRLAIGKSV